MEKSRSSPQREKSYGTFRYDPANNTAKSESILLKPPAISLPNGGGAIRNIDEKFQVNPANGTAALSIPLPFTPGRAGTAPGLSLDYNSGSGNSSFGLGWKLEIPVVQRRTEKKFPLYRDDIDVFTFSGGEDLVPSVEDTGDVNVRRYLPRVEGGFSRIEKVAENENFYWRVTDKNNIVSVFGKSQKFKVCDPANEERVFKWLCEYIYDDKGNVTRFEYRKEDFENVPPSIFEQTRNQNTAVNFYLSKVFYGNVEMYPQDDVAVENLKFLFEVAFVYGEVQDPASVATDPWDCRRDAFSDCRSGFDIRNYRLCHRILFFNNFRELGEGPTLVRAVDLRYDESEAFTFLSGITQRGYIRKGEDYSVSSAPPLEFIYEKLSLNRTVSSVKCSDFASIVTGIDSRMYHWMDLKNEGAPGILSEQGGELYFKANRGNGKFTVPRSVLKRPSFSGFASGAITVQDIESNGVKSVVVNSGQVNGYFSLNEDGAAESFREFVNMPAQDLRDPNLRFIDLDGDGVADILITEERVFRCHLSKGTLGFDEPWFVTRPWDEQQGPSILFADNEETIMLTDMTGDGMTDIVRIRNGETCYWSHRGYAVFGEKITMKASPRFDSVEGFNPRYIKLADVDGSGTTDIVYVGKNEFTVWFNQSGNSWSQPETVVNAFPSMDENCRIDVIDFLGKGTSCLVWSTEQPKYVAAPLMYVDLFKGGKPHVMTGYKNNVGKEIRLNYKSSFEYYLEDLRMGEGWVTRLPFPVQCVDSIEVRDLVSETRFVTMYRYHHGYFDSVEREFRGFGKVEQIDAEFYADYALNTRDSGALNALDHELFQDPVRTTTWFHTGAFQHHDSIIDHYKTEFADKAKTLPAIIFPDAITTAESIEAHRALKGLPVRQEIGTLGINGDHAVLHTITEFNYEIKLRQRRDENQYAVFFPFESENIVFNIEGDQQDARIAHNLNLKIDNYGNVVASAAVVYARKGAFVHPDQRKQFVGYSTAQFIHLDANVSYYRLGLQTERKNYEMVNLPAAATGIYSRAELLDHFRISNFEPYENLEPISDRPGRRLVEYARQMYLSDELNPMPRGMAGSKGLLYDTQVAAFSDSLFQHLYSGNFQSNTLVSEGKYVNDDGLYWISSGVVTYDPDNFFLPVAYTNAFGQKTLISYDGYNLLVARAEDAVQNVTTVLKFNYRTVLPMVMSDPNDNVSAVRYDALGRATAFFIVGKAGDKGDVISYESIESHPDDKPSVHFEYHDDMWVAQQKPNFVRTISHEYHFNFDEHAYAEKTITAFTYSDGSGHEVLSKTEAEGGMAPKRENGDLVLDDNGNIIEENTGNASRWRCTGKKIVNNKGNEVKVYEPYFDSIPDYTFEEELAGLGAAQVFYYDGLGRMIRKLNPDHTFSRVQFDNWKQEIFDENDTIAEGDRRWFVARSGGDLGVEERDAAEKAVKHANTPTEIHLDALGRTILSVVSDARGQSDITTYIRYDMEGNVRSVTDGRNNVVMSWKYDMLGNMCFQRSADGGDRWELKDIAGNPMYRKDSRNHLFSFRYDALQRIVQTRVAGGDESSVYNHVVDFVIYGEGLENDKDRNLRGKIAIHYDTAGKLVSFFDFKGNPIESQRSVCHDYKNPPDWSRDNRDELLENIDHPFTSSTLYDAANRAIRTKAPDGSLTTNVCNKAGLLQSVNVVLDLDKPEKTVVKSIEYNAKGQRTRIVYGNDVSSVYTYDRDTFRLKKLETRKKEDELLQHLLYFYDPVGNITWMRDKAIPTVFFNNFRIEPVAKFEYDALYRLRLATGKEHPAQVNFGRNDNTYDTDFVNYDPENSMQVREYKELYSYDRAGNITEMDHRIDGDQTLWKRTYEYEPFTNRLKSTKIGNEAPYQYAFHPQHGFITGMPHLPVMRWNFKDELVATSRQVVNNGGTPETTYYVYDAQGIRLRKVTENQSAAGVRPSRKNERIYLGNYEVFNSYDAGDDVEEVTTSISVMDDQSRVVLIETGADGNRLFRFQLGNHLGSCHLELDEHGAVITYEEYHPFGTTAHQARNKAIKAAAKRYRYIGKERDEESGFNYHNARYYVPWLGRWLSCDPIGTQGALNLFMYSENSPTVLMDVSGLSPLDSVKRRRVPSISPEDQLPYLNFLSTSLALFDEETKTMPGWKNILGSRGRVRRILEQNIREYKKAVLSASSSDHIVPVPVSIGSLLPARAVEIRPGLELSLNTYVPASEEKIVQLESIAESQARLDLYNGIQSVLVAFAGFKAGVAARARTKAQLVPRGPAAYVPAEGFMGRGVFDITQGTTYLVRSGPAGRYGDHLFNSLPEAEQYARLIANSGRQAIRNNSALPRVWSNGKTGNPVDTVNVFEVPSGTPNVRGVVAPQFETGTVYMTPKCYPGGGPQVSIDYRVPLRQVSSFPIYRE